MPLFDAVLFDLDDTLLDRKATFNRYVSRLFEEYAFIWRRSVNIEFFTQAVAHLDRDGYAARDSFFDEIVKTLGRRSARERKETLIVELTEHFYATFGASAVPLPGMQEAIAAVRAHGLKLGLVTNGSRNQRAKVEGLQLDRTMDTVIVSSEVGIHKPDPGIFKLACDELESAFNRTLFVGDHPLNDAAGAMGAGLVALWIANPEQPWPEEFGLNEPFRIAALSDFPNWLKANLFAFS